jgi:hypothetical protein
MAANGSWSVSEARSLNLIVDLEGGAPNSEGMLRSLNQALVAAHRDRLKGDTGPMQRSRM